MNKYFFIIIILILIIYYNYDKVKIYILNFIVVKRGILAPNCFWYKISDLFISDASGINLYNDLKKGNNDFVLTNMFDEEIYLVTNIKYIKFILDNSPNLFSVGKLKKQIFKSFMEKNVGVSSGCPWKKRRKINEVALDTDKLHIYSEKYNNDIYEQLLKWKDKENLDYNNFFNLGKKMVANIVFNTNNIDDDVFKVFSEANSTEVFFNPDFKIDPKIYKKYLYTLNHFIAKPNPKSLIELCLQVSNDKEEIIQQIPHFIFPIIGLFITTIPRLLILLFNEKNILKKVINEINSIKENNYVNIYQLTYIRKCILETLRLNNPVITTFRTLTQDFKFDDKYLFKKGSQFLILNNPVLREKEYFEESDKFIPDRWTSEMEKSYYAISFNQGPQRCPAKELAIYLAQSFIYNFFKINNITMNTNIETNKIDTNNVPQVINPCNTFFKIKN